MIDNERYKQFYNFESGLWEDEVNIRDFIVKKYTPYDGDGSFLTSPTKYFKDGISNTFSIIPSAIGSDDKSQRQNLVQLMDGYFSDGGYHLNVNVLQKEILEDAMIYPKKYPQLTIRVSGYAINFIKLTREQQEDVISRTFHQRM